MPDILHTLHEHDLGFLKIIAEAWGLELQAPDAETALPLLIAGMSNRLLAQEIIETLPDAAHQAVHALLNNEGRLSWSLFCRRFGEVRSLGAGKRDRERPDLHPASAAEVLWYRGLIGRAFFNLPPEPQEYAYIPEDLLALLEPLSIENALPAGNPAPTESYAHILPASLRILDDACTLLAALRSGQSLPNVEKSMLSIPAKVLTTLCRAAGLIDEEYNPDTEKLRLFLEAEPLQTLEILVKAWQTSFNFNDLRFIPGLIFEGEWQNAPLQTRTTILSMLEQLPQDEWWSLPAFVQAVYERQPDFQRPAGDYDSWFIRPTDSETYLRGFASWEDVDGALLKFIICGPLYWLGMVDLATPQTSAAPISFRPSQWAGLLWQGRPAAEPPSETGSIKINRDGHIRISRHTARAARYQISRFCDWEKLDNGTYHYLLSPASLEKAAKQDLKPAHLLAYLNRLPDILIPPSLLKALKRWEKHGTQAALENVTLLRVDSPEIITALQNSPTARHISDVLNPTTVLIKPSQLNKVRTALVEMGYLVD
jgi:Helicase conserved C-terminal domain